MKDSGIEWIGEIPEDWKSNKIKYLVKIFEKSWIQASKGKLFGEYDFYTSSQELIKKTDIPLFPGDSIVMGTGGMASVNYSRYNYSSSTDCFNFKMSNNTKILYYYLKALQNIINDIGFQGTGLKHLQKDFILNMKFHLPNKEEQKSIIDYLDERINKIDNAILQQKEVIEKLKEYKQALITDVVYKGLNKGVISKPDEWTNYKIKYVAELAPKCNVTVPKNVTVTYTPMEFIKNGYFINNIGKLSDNNSSYNTYLEKDIVMAKVTPCFENGNIAIMENLKQGMGYGSSELFVFRCNEKIYNKYLLYYLQNEHFKRIAISSMTGTGGLKRVSSEFIKNYPICIPGVKEQTQIVQYLDRKCLNIDSAVRKKEEIIIKLEEYKKSLIYECVTGKKETVIKSNEYPAEDIAEWFIRYSNKRQEKITNLKLQKILYYAVGIYYISKKQSLIRENFEAWTHGPVIPTIYSKYKSNGRQSIKPNSRVLQIDRKTEEVLKKNYEIYGRYTAEELRSMTHKEAPWKNAKQKETIEKDIIKDYFQKNVKI